MQNEINFKYDLRDPKSPWPKVFKITGIILLFFFLPYLAGIFFLPYYGDIQTEKSKSSFFEESPDLIAVFTGDSGRIEAALNYAIKHPSSKLLISGVYEKNSIITLIKTNKLQLPANANIDYLSQLIELDYQSQNTLDNVIITLNFLRKNKTFHRVLIISSDYHLARIHLLFHFLTRPDDALTLNYIGVPSHADNYFKRWQRLSVEFFKGIQTIGLLLFWNEEE